MSKPEQKLQIQVANYCKLRYPHLLWTISPAGLIMNRNLGMLSVRLGYRKGTPDLIFFEPRGIFHGLVLELKAGDNDTSEEQRKFLVLALERLYATAVCWTYEEAIKTIDEYLNIKPQKGGTTNEQDKRNGQGVCSTESCDDPDANIPATSLRSSEAGSDGTSPF